LTYFAQKFTGLPKEQVIGSGTFLDAARLKGILASKVGVDAGSVDAYVLGEHGESQMVAWSCVSVGGIPFDQCVPSGTTIDRRAIAAETKDKATEIIDAKGATSYGIGALTASICQSILFDQRNVRPISHWVEDLGCCLSLPVVLGRKGAIRSLKMPLSEEEEKELKKSAGSLKEMLAEAEKSQKD